MLRPLLSTLGPLVMIALVVGCSGSPDQALEQSGDNISDDGMNARALLIGSWSRIGTEKVNVTSPDAQPLMHTMNKVQFTKNPASKKNPSFGSDLLQAFAEFRQNDPRMPACNDNCVVTEMSYRIDDKPGLPVAPCKDGSAPKVAAGTLKRYADAEHRFVLAACTADVPILTVQYVNALSDDTITMEFVRAENGGGDHGGE